MIKKYKDYNRKLEEYITGDATIVFGLSTRLFHQLSVSGAISNTSIAKMKENEIANLRRFKYECRLSLVLHYFALIL